MEDKPSWASPLLSLASRPSPPRNPGPASCIAPTAELIAEPRCHLERYWQQHCDIDPMILRPRLLRHRGELPQVGESAHTRRFALFGQVDFF